MNKTLYDIFSHVMDTEDASNEVVNRRRALRAAVWGLDRAQTRHEWAGYTTTNTTILNAPLDIEVTIDSDGLLTIEAGEPDLPAWTDVSSVVAGEISFVVHQRVDNRKLQLQNYGIAEIASPTKVRVVADRMLIADTVREVYEIRNESDDYLIRHYSAEAFRTIVNRQDGSPGTTYAASVVRSDGPQGRRTEIRFSPAPDSEITVSVSFKRNLRKSRVVHDGSVVSVNAGVVTMENRLPLNTLEQGVFLLSSNSYRPDGEFAYGTGEPNPAEGVYRIESVEADGKIRLEDTSLTGIEGRGGIVTEEIDLPPFAFRAALLYAEGEFRRIGRGESGEYWQTIQLADNELRYAMEQEGTLSRRSEGVGSRAETITFAPKLTERPVT